jgi:signal transduction histidine kinase
MTWQADPTMIDQTRPPPTLPRAGARWHTFLRAPISKHTWACFLYLVISGPFAVAGFMFVVGFLAFGVFSAITFVGLPLIGFTVVSGRWWARLHRRLARKMVGARVEEPAPFQRRSGLLGWLSAALTDTTGWRALVYLVLKFPLAVFGAFGAALFWVEAGLTFLYPAVWKVFDPTNKDSHGHVHHSAVQLGNWYAETWPRAMLVSLVGLVALFLAPWPVRAVVALDGVLMRWLLGPRRTDRVRELEEKRSHAVEDSAAALRRIERDLHDGTQARLVALAMRLGQARETDDPQRLRELVDNAHDNAKDAIAELRDLVRGIHPPVLDQGLDAALATLAARSAVPVELHTHVPQRPSPAIETIAYFCVAELLTNIAKHSGAQHATVQAFERGARLQLEVRDDGHGGARTGAGTGLSGLDERVRTVDGTLTVHSPPGGPTVIAVQLPLGG